MKVKNVFLVLSTVSGFASIIGTSTSHVKVLTMNTVYGADKAYEMNMSMGAMVKQNAWIEPLGSHVEVPQSSVCSSP